MSKWEMVRLGEVSKIHGGFAFKSNQFIKNEIPIIRIGNLDGDTVDLDYDICYPHEFWNKNEAYHIKIGDILIAMSGATVGKIGRYKYNKPALLNQRVGLIRINPNQISSEYIYRYVKSSLFLTQIQLLSFGCAQPNISAKQIEGILIPLPPLETQNQIAKTLDTVSELLAMRKQQLAELENLIKSTFYDMFGDLAFNNKQWNTRELVDICKKENDIKCGPFGTQLNKDEYQTSGVPLWGIPQVNAFFLLPTKDFLSEEKAESLEAYSIIADDITMSRKGNVGKCAIYPKDLPKGIMHSDVLRIRVNQEVVNPTFILHQLHLSRYIQNQIKLVSSGAIMAGVNVSKLKHILVHIPPIELQNSFAEIASKIEEQKALVNKAIYETQYLFDSLMSEYFE